MFGNHGLCGLPEEGAHGKSPKCLGGNLGDFGGILQRSHAVSLEPALRYTALLNDKIDLVEAFSTDAELKQYQLRLLKDDISLFPAYQGAPLMKAEFAEKNPQIVAALNRLAGKISEAEMSEMNYRVKVQGESAEHVARDYLEKNRLLGK